MSNLQDQEKDLFIRKKLREDELVSKKYDDVFESFLKGDHEMKEEPRIEKKKEKTKKQKNGWLRPFAAVAACTLIVTGANVYASTQGYDNIFFLIKDLGNKNKQVTATKDEILSDKDVTISYTNIEIADGLFIQINKFIVKDGKASLLVKVDQGDANISPAKFIVDSNGVNLATEKINADYQKNVSIEYIVDDSSYISQYDYEIKLNNYTDNMKVLKLTIKDEEDSEIAKLEIDLENREIDLVASDGAEEVKKVSEVDLKEKLGDYAILLKPYAQDRDLNDDDKFFLGCNLVTSTDVDAANVSDDGYVYYSKDSINAALKEAIGEELGTNVNSNIFEYNKKLDAYKFITAGDMMASGLCLNIDDLTYENGKYIVTFTYCMPDDQDFMNGTIEELDRFQTTLEFKLNSNERYTKYLLVNFDNVESEKVSVSNQNENNGTTISSNSKQNDFEEEIDLTESTSTNKPNYDPAKVNNYASTMNWTEYWAPGIKFQYPTEWEFSDTPRDGGKGITVNAEATGWAIGKNPDTNEIIESYVTIEVYDQVIAYGSTVEEAYKNFADNYGFEQTGSGYVNENGDEWKDFHDSGSMYDNQAGDTYYVHASELWDGGTPSGEYVIDIVRVLTDNVNNFKVTNITNKVIGNLKLTSK